MLRCKNYNVGIALHKFGHGGRLALMTLDVAGRIGRESLADLPPLPKTGIIDAPDDELHVLLIVPRGTRFHAVIAPGLLARAGTFEYVLGPGSIVDGQEYRWLAEPPMADAPFWLLKAARRAARCGR